MTCVNKKYMESERIDHHYSCMENKNARRACHPEKLLLVLIRLLRRIIGSDCISYRQVK